jgi:hypothetical protein
MNIIQDSIKLCSLYHSAACAAVKLERLINFSLALLQLGLHPVRVQASRRESLPMLVNG